VNGVEVTRTERSAVESAKNQRRKNAEAEIIRDAVIAILTTLADLEGDVN